MNSLIICGYTGIGKTYFSQNFSDSIDIDSATVEKGDNFAKAYMECITDCLGKYKYILVSTHRELRDILASSGLSVILVYPEKNLKNEYLRRYLMRGNSYSYAQMIYEQWDEQISELEKEDRFQSFVLTSKKSLSDVIPLSD